MAWTASNIVITDSDCATKHNNLRKSVNRALQNLTNTASFTTVVRNRLSSRLALANPGLSGSNEIVLTSTVLAANHAWGTSSVGCAGSSENWFGERDTGNNDMEHYLNMINPNLNQIGCALATFTKSTGGNEKWYACAYGSSRSTTTRSARSA